MVATRSETATREAMRGLGRRIRDERSRVEWSLNELAQRARVSRAMLSRVERGESSPTITVLQKVATALGVSPATLIGSQPDRPIVVLRSGAATAFSDPATGYVRQIFPAVEASPVEFIRATLPGGGRSGPLALQPPGTRKYVVVERGRVRLRADGDEVTLSTGDICLFPADVEHSFENPGRAACRLLMLKLLSR